VGDKNVIDEMLKHGFNLGGEQSGHLIFRDHSTTGDGLVCALQILRILKSRNRTLSQLARCWKRFPQLLENISVREKPPFEDLDGLLPAVEQATSELKPLGGRVLLRYSGTEPKVRVLLEGPDPVVLDRWKTRLTDLLRRQIGA
jgi:phosphoglucosamine mutase